MPNAAGDNDDQLNSTGAGQREPSCFATSVTVFLDSFKILLSNPTLFSSIFLIFALPLSLLLSSLALSSTTIRRRISHLESLSAVISVRIEALNILEEARKDAKALFRLRATYALPALSLSVLVLVAAATSASTPFLRRRRPSLSAVGSALKAAWWRVLLTGALAHVSIAGYGQLTRTAAVAASTLAGPAVSLVVRVVAGALEICLMAVFGVGTVVSVVEERFGLEAIWAGWGLMAGRRAVGWVVTAAVVAVTGVIGWEVVVMEEIDVYGEDWKGGFGWTTGMELWRKAGLVCLYGLAIVWSNVVLTVFYCECRRKKHFSAVIVDDDQNIVDNVSIS